MGHHMHTFKCKFEDLSPELLESSIMHSWAFEVRGEVAQRHTILTYGSPARPARRRNFITDINDSIFVVLPGVHRNGKSDIQWVVNIGEENLDVASHLQNFEYCIPDLDLRPRG